METLREILAPDFLLRNSVYISLLVGLTCPLVGVYLVLRRLVFLGVALPQVSSCGIAAAFALHAWHIIPHVEESSEGLLAFAGSTVFTLATILVFAVMERRGRGSVEGRVGAFFKQVALLEQDYAKDNKLSVQTVLKDAGLGITGFARFKVGA